MTLKTVGLTSEEVRKSKEKHGDNTLEKEKTKGFFRKFFENLNDPIIKILIIALLIEVIFTFGKCNLFEVFGIVMAILLATTVSTVSEFGSERAFEKMQSESVISRVKALRDGQITEISVSDIVVGDVLYLSAGEQIAADGALISGRISVDQSALNGESKEILKSFDGEGDGYELSSKNKVFRGTLVTVGEAVMRVERVGAATYYGMVAKDVQTETRTSPLKHRLSRLAGQISKIGYVMAIIVGLVYIFNTLVVDNGFVWERVLADLKSVRTVVSTLTHALTLMITVIVVAVPEGLPMMITVVLSANMKKMIKDKVLVKKLVGIETAGSLNILFTDKTGTITVGVPRCEKIISIDASYKSLAALKRAEALREALTVSARYNTASYESAGRIIGGNGTDRSILEFFRNEAVADKTVAEKEAFSSEKKLSSVSFSDGSVFIKGAPEIILSKSELALGSDGRIIRLSRSDIEGKLREETSKGNRVIAVAMKNADRPSFIFLGLIVLKDMLRRETREAIFGIQRAGVQIVMLTGDGKETAMAIAEECGIIRHRAGEICLTSSELGAMSDDEVKKIIPNLCVLARALPQDKTRLVRLSQELELVVGMTGDGINDAPSLKLADVGFAMGAGTDIAKAAGDVVIQNNSLMAINRSILYGRTIFKSIKKFISFQLVMNFAACGVSLFGQLFGIDSPITIIQMLWVNIIMDTLGGLAFAGEPALEYYMKEKPKTRSEPILTKKMLGKILISGGYTLVLCLAFLKLDFFSRAFVGKDGGARFMTAFYALFIFLGIFNCFIARSERVWLFSSISKNRLFVFIMLIIAIIQIIMIYCGGELFRAVPLRMGELFSVILLAFTIIPFDVIYRIFTRLK